MENAPDFETVEYHLVYVALIQAARHRGTVTYQELALLVGLPLTGSYMGNRFSRILWTIAQNEFKYDRPMLSALCVNVYGEPGKAFFPLAREFGLLESDDPNSERRFWEGQKRKCYEIWQQKFQIKSG